MTTSSYRLQDLMKFFQARKSAYHTSPRLIDEAIYTTYSYDSSQSRFSSSLQQQQRVRDGDDSGRAPSQTGQSVGDLLGVSELLLPTAEATERGEAANIDDVITGKNKDLNGRKRRKFDSGKGQYAEVFLFEYGTVVIWGMTEAEEKRFLSSM